MSDDDLRKANCDLVRRYIGLINAWDFDAMREIMAEDFVFEMRFAAPGMPARLEGRDALLDYQREVSKTILAENLHDLWLDTLHSDPGEVIAEDRSDMTRADPTIGYANEDLCRLTVRDGLIPRFQENYDPHRAVASSGGALPSTPSEDRG